MIMDDNDDVEYGDDGVVEEEGVVEGDGVEDDVEDEVQQSYQPMLLNNGNNGKNGIFLFIHFIIWCIRQQYTAE